MRIALYHNLPSGGALRVLEEYVRHMGKHHLELFVPNTVERGFRDLETRIANVRVFKVPGDDSRLGRYRRLRAVPKFGRQIARAIDAGDFDVVLAGASFITQAPEILPYLKTPTVYFCPEPLRAVYDRELNAADRSGRTLLRSLYAAPYDRRRAQLDRRSIRRADRIFTNSKFTRRRLREIYGVNSEVIYGGADPKLFKPERQPRDGFVLSVGALHPAKGHQSVIDAVAGIKVGKRPNVIVVGDRGDYAAELEALALRDGVRLKIRQQVPLPELISLFQRATVFCAAQHLEPFGLVVLEAMACQTPVVAVHEGGFKESVQDGKTGLLANRKDLGLAIERVLASPRLAKRLGAAARADVVRRWQWPRMAREIDRLLAKTAKKG